ncbi:MAG: transcriptional regulator [Bacteroidetes bacterium]|nr:transcriptional regulator [Bacteroidota bacterium]
MEFRSDCPISSALDIVGDKWTLLILRDMLFGEKKTFKEFSSSSEHIASGILSNRLLKMEEMGLICKSKVPENKKTVIYSPTEKGKAFLPLLREMILWSDHYLHDHINEKMKQTASAIRNSRMAN